MRALTESDKIGIMQSKISQMEILFKALQDVSVELMGALSTVVGVTTLAEVANAKVLAEDTVSRSDIDESTKEYLVEILMPAMDAVEVALKSGFFHYQDKS